MNSLDFVISEGEVILDGQYEAIVDDVRVIPGGRYNGETVDVLAVNFGLVQHDYNSTLYIPIVSQMRWKLKQVGEALHMGSTYTIMDLTGKKGTLVTAILHQRKDGSGQMICTNIRRHEVSK